MHNVIEKRLLIFGIIFTLLYLLFFCFSLISLKVINVSLVEYLFRPLPLGIEKWIILIYFLLISVAYYLLFTFFYNKIITKKGLQIIIFFIFIFHVILFLSFPVLSSDITGYIARAGLVTDYHVNPYQFSPSEIDSSIISNWSEMKMTYGPLWTIFSSFIKIFSHDFARNIFIFRLFIILFNFGCIFLIYQIMAKIRPELKNFALLIYAWNPIVLLAAVNNGHNDTILAFFILLAIYLILIGKKYLVIVSIVMSILIKYTMIVFLPIFLIYFWHKQGLMKDKMLFTIRASILMLIIILLAASPYLCNNFFQGLSEHFQTRTDVSIGVMTLMIINKIIHTSLSFSIINKISLLIFLIIFIFLTIKYFFQKNTSFKFFIDTLSLTLIIFLLFLPFAFHPWYYLWIIGLAIIWAFNSNNIKRNIKIIFLISFFGLIEYIAAYSFLIVIFTISIILYFEFMVIRTSSKIKSHLKNI